MVIFKNIVEKFQEDYRNLNKNKELFSRDCCTIKKYSKSQKCPLL